MLNENYKEPFLPNIIDYKLDDWKIEIETDSDSDNPRNWDNLGEFCVSNRCRYCKNEYEDSDALSWYDEKDDFKTLSKTHIVLPLSYYDHSGVSIYIGSPCDRWDSGRLGWYIVSKEKIKQEFNVKRISAKLKSRVIEYLENEVKTFNQWINNEVYSFTLYHNGEEEDSCGGFYDIDDIYEYLPKEYTSAFTREEMKQHIVEI